MYHLYIRFVITLFLSAYCFSSHARSDDSYAFALIGDLPYGVDINEKNKEYDKLVEQVNSDPSVRWVLHVGDIKRGRASCSDEFLLDRKRRFARFTPAFILTPGDNEWTDCHRKFAGSYDPLERLDKLRELFFSEKNHKLAAIDPTYLRQSETNEKFLIFRENILWKKGPIIYATVHMVGSSNGYDSFSFFSNAKRSSIHNDEITHRTNAALNWISKAFKIAKRDSAQGVFISTHANPGLADYMDNKEKSIYTAFLERLYRESINFDGHVILAHGDSHFFRIDKPVLYNGDTPKNFTRIETYGALNGNWIKVKVTPNEENLFSFSNHENNP